MRCKNCNGCSMKRADLSMRKSRVRMSRIDPSTDCRRKDRYSSPSSAVSIGIPEHGDVAEFMAEHQRQPGQEQRLALRRRPNRSPLPASHRRSRNPRRASRSWLWLSQAKAAVRRISSGRSSSIVRRCAGRDAADKACRALRANRRAISPSASAIAWPDATLTPIEQRHKALVEFAELVEQRCCSAVRRALAEQDRRHAVPA